MTLDEFEASLTRDTPPPGVPAPLASLWHDARGDWHRAHQIAQGLDGPQGARVHAYLHRKEGDAGNAAYWYRRAGREMPAGSLDEEWRTLAVAFTTDGGRVG